MTISEAMILHDVERALENVVNGQQFDANLVVTATRLDDGSYIELSRFGDSVWRLPDALFPTNVRDCCKLLKFARTPASFQCVLKVIVLRYYLYGVEGGGRPRGDTIRKFHERATVFLRFLDKRGIDCLGRVNTLLTNQYVETCRSEVSSQTGERLAAQTLAHRFAALETLHRVSRHTSTPMPHPWPETSATVLSGQAGNSHGAAKTLVIPEAVLSALFNQAHGRLEEAERLLDHRDATIQWREEGGKYYINKWLAERGYNAGLGYLNDKVDALLTACMLIVLTSSGIRVSELGSLRRGCAYTTVGDEDERYHWICGRSDKTHKGETSWLVPEIAHCALGVAERITEPLLHALQGDIDRLMSENSRCPEAASLKRHRDAVFLGQTQGQAKRIQTLSGGSVQRRVNLFAKAHGHDWHFTSHQFRRTFAVYAAHSAYGDLRYLKEHFKHWSLDMTALYAMDERQDAELYDEMLAAVREIKVQVVEHWLDKDTPMSGGMAEPIKNFRQSHEAVRTYAGRREMAEKLSDQVSIRSTGVAWCTADFGNCNGGQGVETTRCGSCQQSVIDDNRQAKWEGLYAQQIELRQIEDIGPAGQHRVERDISRCAKVLTDLGADPARLERHG